MTSMLKSRVVVNSLLFLSLAFFGFSMAAKRPVWNDEIYSQKASIESLSYKDIFAGKIREGNNSPLFYSAQKALAQIFSYTSPRSMSTQYGEYFDMRSQILLRLVSILSMSAMMIIFFHFFCKNLSFLWGLYSLGIIFSSFIIWPYWAEARPYVLWMLLGTLQMVYYLKIVMSPSEPRQSLRNLAIIHILLSLTTTISAVQIAAVTLLLWRTMIRHKAVLFWAVGLPFLIIFFYYSRAVKFSFWFKEAPYHIIFASVPMDRLALLGIFGLGLLIVVLKTSLKDLQERFKLEILAFSNFLLLLIAASALLLVFKMKETPLNGFQVSNRYFIFLFPSSVAAMVLSSRGLIKLCGDHKLLKIAGIFLILVFLCYRFQRTLPFTLAYF